MEFSLVNWSWWVEVRSCRCAALVMHLFMAVVGNPGAVDTATGATVATGVAGGTPARHSRASS